MDMISYWKSTVRFYDEDGELFLIYGFYDHKNQSGKTSDENRCIGVYWREDFPSARGRLAPCVIPPKTARILLKGLFFELLSSGEQAKAERVSEAIRFLDGEK